MITGIWENEYVQYLGILEHLDECKILHDEYLTCKARKEFKPVVYEVYGQFEKELVDLYLILQKRFHNDPMVEERLERFAEKSLENNKE